MKTTRTKRAVWPLALVSAAFLLGCQEQASGPTGPEGSSPLLTHRGPEHGKKGGGGGGGGGGEDPTEPVTWSEADASPQLGGPTGINTLQSSCSGFPGAKTSNPTVEWNDEPLGEDPGSTDGCAQVTTTNNPTEGVGPVLLTNDALLIVGTKKGLTKFTIQFQIQDVGGPDGIQYRTDKFAVENDHLSRDDLNKPFTGEAPFTLHIHSRVEIWKLKGHTGGPKVESAGYIYIGDIVYK